MISPFTQDIRTVLQSYILVVGPEMEIQSWKNGSWALLATKVWQNNAQLTRVVTLVNWKPILESCIVRLVVKKGHQKDIVLSGDWTMCFKYINHSKFNSEHNFTLNISSWGELLKILPMWLGRFFTFDLFCISIQCGNWKLQFLQLTIAIGRECSLSDPTAKIICGVGSAHSRATHLTCGVI